MFDADKDTPVQVKHPEWVEWFKDNQLDVYRIARDPAPEYDIHTGELTVSLFHRGKPVDADGEATTYQRTLSVKTPPPWFDLADVDESPVVVSAAGSDIFNDPREDEDTTETGGTPIKDEKPAAKPKPAPKKKP